MIGRAITAVATLALTACSAGAGTQHDAAPVAQRATPPSTTGAIPASPLTQPHPDGATGDAAAGAGASGPAASASSMPPGAEIALTLGAACVVPGGEQTLTITTRQQASISFNTRYADGRRGDAYGGVGIGTSTAQGTYRSAFAVSAAAATGRATVTAGMSRDNHWWTAPPATFTVAARC